MNTAEAGPAPQPYRPPPSSVLSLDFQQLKSKLETYLKPEDVGRVEAAYHFSADAHAGQFRVSGEHIAEVRALARQVADKVRENPHVVNVHLDWEEPSKVVILNIDQDRARALGVNTAELSRFLQGSLSGTSVSQYREGNELIEILQRGTPQERKALSLLPSLAVSTDSSMCTP